MSEDQDFPSSPRSWPKKWVREESFWREMTTRTLSGLLVVATVAIFAVISGFGTHEQRMRVVILVGINVLVAAAIRIYVYWDGKHGPKYTLIHIFENSFGISRIGEGKRKNFVWILYEPWNEKSKKYYRENLDAIQDAVSTATGIDRSDLRFRNWNAERQRV